MAPKKSRKTAPAKKAVEETTTEPTGSGLERVLNRDSVQPNWKAFSAFVEAAGGPKINPKHVGIVLTGYKYFQKSDAAVSAREEAASAKAEAKAEREAAAEQRAKDRAAKAEERETARKAAKKATSAKKATPKKTTAAAASKPKQAVKKTAAKKSAAKKGAGRKAAF
jgi:DNA-binding protein HU-beta